MSGELRVQNLGKAYREWGSEWRRMASWVLGRISPRAEQWVIRDMSFFVGPGEAVGILGKNGAGKSTLLKLIAGTTQPTTGRVEVNGRVAAILELGMGFNPDLTGRENAFHSAGLMGYRQADIQDVMADIESFADIGEYFDSPVRVYSSGMQARVAFAVATAFRPEVLIIDEVLAVGDAAFQRKCFRRLDEFVQNGTALLFVSHDTESVKRICNKAMHIDQGRLLEFGDAKSVCDHYERALFGGFSKSETEEARTMDAEPRVEASRVNGCEVAYGDGRAFIESIWLEDGSGNPTEVLPSNSIAQLCYRVRTESTLHDPIFAVMIKTREGIALFGTDSMSQNHHAGTIEAGTTVEVRFAMQNNLAPGTYYVNCGIRDPRSETAAFIHRRVDAVIFRITKGNTSTPFAGLVDMAASLNVTRVA